MFSSLKCYSTSEESSPLLSAKMPIVTMRIFDADTTRIVVADNVKIGDPLSIVINMNDTDRLYGLYITDCSVQDGLGWSQQHLIDAYGYENEYVLSKFF